MQREEALAGHAWCAIQLGPPVDDIRAQREEFGWLDGRGWASFPIVRTAVFMARKVTQYAQGGPFRLCVCDETADLQRRYYYAWFEEQH